MVNFTEQMAPLTNLSERIGSKSGTSMASYTGLAGRPLKLSIFGSIMRTVNPPM